jgi:hypothetical protein
MQPARLELYIGQLGDAGLMDSTVIRVIEPRMSTLRHRDPTGM